MKRHYDIETLARWACTLDSWEWPEDMSGKPEGFDEMPCWFGLGDPRRNIVTTRYHIVHLYINAIKDRIGEKEILRWHHLHKLGHTNEYFEEFWKEHMDRVMGIKQYAKDVTLYYNDGTKKTLNNHLIELDELYEKRLAEIVKNVIE